MSVPLSVPQMSVPPLISLRNAGLAYGARELWEHLSLDIEPGQFIAVLGANGSGKTSLLRVLLGELQLTSGEAWIAGRAGPPRQSARRLRAAEGLHRRGHDGPRPRRRADGTGRAPLGAAVRVVGHAAAGQAARRRAARRRSAPPRSATRRCRCSPAVSCSASGSPRRSPQTRGSCSATNRSPHWTCGISRTSPRCSTGAAASTAPRCLFVTHDINAVLRLCRPGAVPRQRPVPARHPGGGAHVREPHRACTAHRSTCCACRTGSSSSPRPTRAPGTITRTTITAPASNPSGHGRSAAGGRGSAGRRDVRGEHVGQDLRLRQLRRAAAAAAELDHRRGVARPDRRPDRRLRGDARPDVRGARHQRAVVRRRRVRAAGGRERGRRVDRRLAARGADHRRARRARPRAFVDHRRADAVRPGPRSAVPRALPRPGGEQVRPAHRTDRRRRRPAAGVDARRQRRS